MKKIFIILLLICFASVCWAQVEDNFTDGDLTTNPTWTPDNANNWTVVSGQLRSNSGTASSSFYITTPSAKALTAQWEFYLQLQFNTSSANYVDVHLTSAQADLSSAANNGYFVRIGGTPDEISLYKVSAGTASLLINGTDGVTNRTNNPLRIKVIRDANNNWTLERDAAGGTAYVLEGSVTDNSFTTSSYFGIRIQQSTATFFNKHFFDDITVSNIFVETDPPVLSALQVQSNSTLSLQFNEPLNSASAQTVANYVASNNIGNPSQAVLQPDQKTVLLTFPQPFPNGVSNTIEIAGVQDLVGNTILQISQPFLFFLPSPYTPKDIIVTEIFADPSPQVGLPEAEFIEIFNRSTNPIDLAGWKFSDGNSSAVFPSQKIILPNQYWIVCSTANASLFSPSGNTLGVPNFPTLNNGGEALTLKTNAGLLMDSINYSTAWYRDADKQEGGWTLELINTNNPCGEEDNWTASENPNGGTPGKINSINANKPDIIGPKLLAVVVTNPTELIVGFDEKLEKPIGATPFIITPPLDISAVSFTSLSLREIKITLSQAIVARQLYSLEIKGLRDCNQNIIQDGFNKLSFRLDNILAEKDPPMLNSLQVSSNTTLTLLFNETLSATSAQNASNYTASNGIGNPSQAELAADEKAVMLSFSQPFANGIANTLNISGVQDLWGNVILPVSRPFLFFQPSPFAAKDIIVTEIFADPSPQVGLPEAEFIEIFNRSANPIDLNGWKFSDGNSNAVFPSQKIILPNQYWIVCSTANASLFSASANTLGVANFPTLNNGGEALTLKTNAGLLMDSINYSTAWYRDVDKQEGGWTLELIDTNNPCGEEGNWTASENPNGGTPGKINSVSANKPDLTGPTLLSISIVKPNELVIRFNEKLEKSISASAFTFTPTLSVSKVSFTSLSLRDVNVVLLQDLSPRQLYNLEVKGLRDCNGNFIQDGFNKLSLALPEAAETGDLFINEILFNPRPGGVDFVEVINVSAKYINLKGWSLANREDGANTNLKLITTKDQIIPPQEFVVFTTDGAVIKSEYPNAIEKSLFNTTLPSLSDDAGSLVLLSEQGTEVDHFAYTDDFHSKLLKDKEGVSLERISLIEPTIIPDNWKSANAAAGYATPGYLNSNSRPENLIDENAVKIEPEIFSPVVPGQDFAQINYRFDQSSLSANVKIVDHQGRLIKEIANNETLAFDGFFRWDGDRDDGSKARMGYYFIWFEVFDLEGLVKTFRKRVVIGR